MISGNGRKKGKGAADHMTLLEPREIWQITEEDIACVETAMTGYATTRKTGRAAAVKE